MGKIQKPAAGAFRLIDKMSDGGVCVCAVVLSVLAFLQCVCVQCRLVKITYKDLAKLKTLAFLQCVCVQWRAHLLARSTTSRATHQAAAVTKQHLTSPKYLNQTNFFKVIHAKKTYVYSSFTYTFLPSLALLIFQCDKRSSRVN